MNRQNFKNANGMFPVTTETFDFMQEQILMLGNLARMAGCNVVIKEAKEPEMLPWDPFTMEDDEDPGMTPAVDGLAVINGEIMPLRVGDGLYAPYVKIVEETEAIMANDSAFPQIRVKRHAEYTDEETDIPANSLKNVARNGIADLIYPVGSLYLCLDAISPAVKFGGVWSRIETGDYLKINGGNLERAGETGGTLNAWIEQKHLPNIKVYTANDDDSYKGRHQHIIKMNRTDKAGTSTGTVWSYNENHTGEGNEYTETNVNGYKGDHQHYIHLNGKVTQVGLPIEPCYLTVNVWQRIA